jgi:hypothetical protein
MSFISCLNPILHKLDPFFEKSPQDSENKCPSKEEKQRLKTVVNTVSLAQKSFPIPPARLVYDFSIAAKKLEKMQMACESLTAYKKGLETEGYLRTFFGTFSVDPLILKEKMSKDETLSAEYIELFITTYKPLLDARKKIPSDKDYEELLEMIRKHVANQTKLMGISLFVTTFKQFFLVKDLLTKLHPYAPCPVILAYLSKKNITHPTTVSTIQKYLLDHPVAIVDQMPEGNITGGNPFHDEPIAKLSIDISI